MGWDRTVIGREGGVVAVMAAGTRLAPVEVGEGAQQGEAW